MTIRDLAIQLKEHSAETRRQFIDVNARLDAVDARFDAVDARFDAVDARLDAVDARFDSVDARFDAVDARFAEVNARFGEVSTRFGEVSTRFGEAGARFQTIADQIREEGETTRRHFDIVAEQFRSEVRLALDKSVATADQLSAFRTVNEHEHAGFAGAIDDHEARLRALEPKS